VVDLRLGALVPLEGDCAGLLEHAHGVWLLGSRPAGLTRRGRFVSRPFRWLASLLPPPSGLASPHHHHGWPGRPAKSPSGVS
jgi:hypothetical protein